eukprot:CAMPEP_0184700300 /NCGR_PEP_ID=MMETSP0313-20130426/11635_1 /TAXON_ID=2792 /ORGANISM="Porphyridium aerugineum, Strain SAG 1380-2" /LENGTH=436 /DNA_ID=CAMNT_0027159895 /DNA_START=101 /DNA_END=1411 /DNA_ORIENTATION=+
MQVQPAKISGLDRQPSPTQSSNKSSRRRKGDEMESGDTSKHKGFEGMENETAGPNIHGAGVKAMGTEPSPKRQKTLGTTAPKPLMNRTNTLGANPKMFLFKGVVPAKVKSPGGPLSFSQPNHQAQGAEPGDSQQSENCENQAPVPSFKVSNACSQPFQLPQLVSRLSTAAERSVVTGSAGTGMRIVPSNSSSTHMKRITSVYIKEQKEERARELKEGKLETPSKKDERDGMDDDGDADGYEDTEEIHETPGNTLEPPQSSTKKSTRQRFRIRTRNPKAFILPGSTLANRLDNLMQDSVGSAARQGSRQDRNDSQQGLEMSEAEKQAMFNIVRQPPVSASQLAMSQDSHGIPCSLTGAALNSQPGNQRVIPVPLSQVLDDPLPTLSQGSGGIHVLLKASQEADEYEESLNYSSSRKSSLSPSLLASEKETRKKKAKN